MTSCLLSQEKKSLLKMGSADKGIYFLGLVGCSGFNGPLRQNYSQHQAVPP